MKKITTISLAVVAAIALGGCNLFQVTETMDIADMTLSSMAFEADGRIPAEHAKEGVEGGKNTPIPYSWSEAPEGTKSFALTIIDPHQVARDWVHLITIDIPSNVTEVYSATSSYDPSSGELTNSYGEVGYGGPKPPAGTGNHPYVGTIYALDIESLPIKGKVSEAEFLDAVDGHVLAKGSYTGYFSQD